RPEQGSLAPVKACEADPEGWRLRQLLAPRAGGPRDPLRAALGLDRLEDTGGEPEQVCDRLVLAGRAELVDRVTDGVVVGDSRRRLDHLGEWPVGDPLAVGQAAAGEHRRALEPFEEIAGEAALPPAGLARDRDDGRPVRADAATVGVLEQLELGLATDEGRARARPDARRAVHGADGAPDPDRPVDPLQLYRPELFRLDGAEAEAVGGRAEQQ